MSKWTHFWEKQRVSTESMSCENSAGEEESGVMGGRARMGGGKLTVRLPHSCSAFPGITGILMSAAGLPVCLTRPPKLVLHPPPVSKSEIKSIPGVSNTSRKTTKKQAKKGTSHLTFWGTESQGLGSQPLLCLHS